MALAIATNNAALRAAAAASGVNRDMETSMARLSSGKRINSASDDAAGVAISSRLTANIRGTDQAIRNALDGQALIDTAEGTYKEIENILQRLREISVQAANDTNDANDRRNLQAEMSALNVELDRIAEVTTWAGQNLLDGSFANKTLQIGSNTGMPNQIEVSIPASGLSDLLASESAGEADFATGGGLGAITDVKTIMGPEDTSINSSSFSVTPQAIIALDGGNFAVNAGVFFGRRYY
jgi:flagellin